MITRFYRFLSVFFITVAWVFILPPAIAQRADTTVVKNAMANFTIKNTPMLVPETIFFDEQGAKLSLRDFAGKVLLVNLWATWCAPCRDEMPALDALQSDMDSSLFQVVPISADRQGSGVVRNFYDKLGIENLSIYNDKTMKTHLAFRARGLPTTLLIDRKGREIGRLVGPARWDSKEARQLISSVIWPK